MSGQSLGLRRLVKASAVVLGVGLLLAGCAPVKFGSAATAGNDGSRSPPLPPMSPT